MSTIFSLLSIILDISIPFVLLESIEGQDPKFAQTSCNGLKQNKKELIILCSGANFGNSHGHNCKGNKEKERYRYRNRRTTILTPIWDGTTSKIWKSNNKIVFS